MQSNNYAYVNGRFVPEAEATVSIFDRGFLYGDGVFETMRVYDGQVFRLHEHLVRLFDALAHFKIESPLPAEELRTVCNVLVERNQVRNGFARVYATSGRNQLGATTVSQHGASLVATAGPIEFESPQLRLIISSVRLDPALSRFKTANRLPYITARREAERAGASEAVLLNAAGRVAELSTSNLFVVKAGELFTPSATEGPLPGITRDVVLTLAGEMLLPTHEAMLGLQSLENADELFATNSLMEIVPVIQFKDRVLAKGSVTERLENAYREFVRQELDL